MDTIVRQAWTQEEFFPWAEAQEGKRYEFDGIAPVDITGDERTGMTGGGLWHDQITLNLLVTLRMALRGGSFFVRGPNAGVATSGKAVRYPDALVDHSPAKRNYRLVAAPVIVFEVISPTTEREDRIVKPREYGAVPSILRYVIVEAEFVGLTVMSRSDATQPWTSTPIEEGVLPLPEVGVEIPVDAIYEGVDFTP